MGSIPKVVVTEHEWIRIGIERFAKRGVEGLVIESMAVELGCSKSSFYWYFKNRNEFLVKIVRRWSELYTEQIIQAASTLKDNSERIMNMLQEMFSGTQRGDFLFYLRRLSQEAPFSDSHTPSYKAMLATVEKTRMQHATQLFIEAGMNEVTAEQKSQFLYHYYLGWYERHKYNDIEAQQLQLHIQLVKTQLLYLP